jgi:nucleotide-binding universal stress UspA family protein
MNVLLATDLSTAALLAHEVVRTMALPAGSRIRVVHAIEPVTTVQLFAPAALLTIGEAAEIAARSEVTRYAKVLARPSIESDAVIGIGRAADVILDEAASFKPDIIVVGSRGHGGIASAVLGSVSAELVDRAQCPVLVARAPKLASLILAEDGSAAASIGARVIKDIPALAGLPVDVVSVVDVPFPTLAIDPSATGAALQAYREYEATLPAIRAAHAGLARDRALALRALGVDATSEQREGDAAAQLIAAAVERGADCIVIGSRGQTGLRRLALGSVARNVLFHAPCSVLIARESASTLAPAANGHAPAAAGHHGT